MPSFDDARSIAERNKRKKLKIVSGSSETRQKPPSPKEQRRHQSPSTFKKCYESHKPFDLGNGYQIHGGSCIRPIDADVYAGFDLGMKQHLKKMLPWNNQAVLYPIVNNSVPKDLEEFKKLLDWLIGHVTTGKKVHIGCIGGHGRTGIVLAALRYTMTGDTEAAMKVRGLYCGKAIETQDQLDWLRDNFGQDITGLKPRYPNNRSSQKSTFKTVTPKTTEKTQNRKNIEGPKEFGSATFSTVTSLQPEHEPLKDTDPETLPLPTTSSWPKPAGDSRLMKMLDKDEEPEQVDDVIDIDPSD